MNNERVKEFGNQLLKETDCEKIKQIAGAMIEEADHDQEERYQEGKLSTYGEWLIKIAQQVQKRIADPQLQVAVYAALEKRSD